jgi:hypothetical protein
MPPDLFDTLLWGWTGWPCFWSTDNPPRELWYRLYSLGRFYRRFRTLPADYIEEALRSERCDSFEEMGRKKGWDDSVSLPPMRNE